MAANAQSGNGRRRSQMDLAPLERDCMLALWPMGEATVRQIRDELADTRPRAYTTIMTIMDRLAKKGVVQRHKVGRGYVYKPNFSADDVREHAVGKLVEHFFDGSSAALREHLGGGAVEPARSAAPAPKAAPARIKPVPAAPPAPVAEEKPEELPPTPRLDDVLL